MKNLELLAIDAKTREAIERTAQNYARFNRLQTDILEVSEGAITVRIEQTERQTDKVYTAKELNEKAKEVFSHLPEGSYKVRVRPLTYKGEGLEAVSAEWVKNNLKKHGLNQADVCRAFGIDKHAMSKLLSNDYAFTRWHKAAFYFYFKTLTPSGK